MGLDCDKPNGLNHELRNEVRPEPVEKIAVLIYENVDRDIHTIEYLCRQFGFDYYLARTEPEALAILETRPVKVAVVNYALDKIKIRNGIAVVATGDPNTAASMHIIGYFPVWYVPKPLTFSAVSLGLVKAARIWNDSRTYPSQLVNAMTVLAELQAKLKAMAEEPDYQWTIEQSMTRFCEEDCSHAKTGSQVSQDVPGKGQIEVLAYFTPRGTLFCKRKKVCELWGFLRWLKEKHPALAGETPADLLTRTDASVRGGIYAAVADLVKRYNERVGLLYDLKLTYDTGECPACKSGLDFQKGDNIFSRPEDMILGRNCKFCSEGECPLDKFFELFKRKIL